MMDVEMTAPQALTQTSKEALRQIVEKIERLETDKSEIAGEIKDVYADAKARGFDSKAIRAVVRLRKTDRREREEMEQILDLYLHAIGEL